jgi:para-aminobenzoate synthetase component 1
MPHGNATPSTPTPCSVFDRVRAHPGAVWLDGGRTPDGWTILAWDPVEVVTDGNDWPDVGRRLSGRAQPDGLPFSGGCLGYLGYGAGHRVETVPAEAPTPEPEVWLGRFEGALCFRHHDLTWHLGGTPSFRREAQRVLESAVPLAPPHPARQVTARRTTDRARYEGLVRRIQGLIAAGDCYQVNLTRPVFLEGVGDAWDAFRRLRALSGPPHAAWLTLAEDLAILSNSPELFLAASGRNVASRPIKGTRPRDEEPLRDAALAAELERSDKDRAELAMIVDLVRNDLGRVAVPGSVRALPRVLTAHANVHHSSTTVQATLEPGRDAWDALGALFPPGSVTGAPKIRACRRIAELEDSPRGVYCGAIGFVSATGIATWSVAIRTAVVKGSRLRYHVGGGIVADSEPSAEWWETVHKGTAMERAFAAPARSGVRDTHVVLPRATPAS